MLGLILAAMMQLVKVLATPQGRVIMLPLWPAMDHPVPMCAACQTETVRPAMMYVTSPMEMAQRAWTPVGLPLGTARAVQMSVVYLTATVRPAWMHAAFPLGMG